MESWDTTTGESLPSIGKQDGGANAIALSSDERSIATVTQSGDLYLWEIASGKSRLVVKDAGHEAPIAFSPDGRLLALANAKQERVQIVRISDGKVIRRFCGHLGRISFLCFAPDGRALASGGYDSTVLVWDVAGLTESR
jgi:WD40 repeat protein